jgi:hypothetical protein
MTDLRTCRVCSVPKPCTTDHFVWASGKRTLERICRPCRNRAAREREQAKRDALKRETSGPAFDATAMAAVLRRPLSTHRPAKGQQ